MGEKVTRIINVMASSLNGKIGAHELESDEERQTLGLSSTEDHQFLRNQIKISDAIIVGATSVRANGECLDEVGRMGVSPVWYILTKQGLDPGLAFWDQHHIPRILVSPTPTYIKSGSGVRNLVLENASPARVIFEDLRANKLETALLFGGGIVNRFFYEENLVDELKLTLSPLYIGGKSQAELIDSTLKRHVRFRLLSSHQCESFVFLSYEVLK